MILHRPARFALTDDTTATVTGLNQMRTRTVNPDSHRRVSAPQVTLVYLKVPAERRDWASTPAGRKAMKQAVIALINQLAADGKVRMSSELTGLNWSHRRSSFILSDRTLWSREVGANTDVPVDLSVEFHAA